eukprot:6171986-Pleurochrysis_carterae.AAC.2
MADDLGVVSAHDSRHAAYIASYMACLPRMRLLFHFLARLGPEREPLPAVATTRASISRISAASSLSFSSA